MPAAMMTRQERMVGRRPIRSAMAPRMRAPMPMPISSIDRTRPSAARSMPQSRAMPGAAKLIDSTSKPSSAFSAVAMPMAITWRKCMGSRAMIARGSSSLISSTYFP